MKSQPAERDTDASQPLTKLGRLCWVSVVFTLLVIGINLWMTTSARPLIFHELSTAPTNSVGLLLGVDRILRDGSTNLHFVARTEAAAQLVLSGKVASLLVSGHPNNRGYNEPRGMAAELVRLGVPATRLNLDESGERTWESVRSARHHWNVDRCVVITDEFHAARALFLCHRAGIQAVAYSPPNRSQNHWTAWSHIREWFARLRALADFD